MLARIKALKSDQLYAQLRAEVAAWRFPYRRHKAMSQNIWQVFSEKRAKSNADANGWKSSSSELLTVVPIVLNWADTHFGERLLAEVESMRMPWAVISYLLDLKFGRANDADHLRALIEAHFRKHVLVYGDGLIGLKCTSDFLYVEAWES